MIWDHLGSDDWMSCLGLWLRLTGKGGKTVVELMQLIIGCDSKTETRTEMEQLVSVESCPESQTWDNIRMRMPLMPSCTPAASLCAQRACADRTPLKRLFGAKSPPDTKRNTRPNTMAPAWDTAARELDASDTALACRACAQSHAGRQSLV